MSIWTEDLSVSAAKRQMEAEDHVQQLLSRPVAMSPAPVRRQRWQKMLDPQCCCGAKGAIVHSIVCPQAGTRRPVQAANPVTIQQQLFAAAGIKPPRKKKRARVPPPIPSYRFVLQFNFTRPINISLWKKIKAPKGWKKNPTSASNQDMYRGVRFRCDDFKYALSAEDITLLHMRLLMCLQS